MTCGINAGYKMFSLVHQCMRNTNINNKIFLCQRFSTLKKALRPVPLIKLSHKQIKEDTIRYEDRGLNLLLFKRQVGVPLACNLYSNDCAPVSGEKKNETEPEKKASLYQRFKAMCKKYWYVLIPFHVFSSVIWFGGLYYVAASGIDIPQLLETLGAPENWVQNFRNTKAGNVVVAYTLYKVCTPFRYAVTLGGTKIILNYLSKYGWVQAPTREQMKKLYQDQKDAFKDLKDSYKDKMQVTKTELSKAKDKMRKQLDIANEEFRKAVIETEKDLKDMKGGFKEGAEEWKTFSRAVARDFKKATSKKD